MVEERRCPICGNPLTSLRKKYCSVACCDKAYNIKRREQRRQTQMEMELTAIDQVVEEQKEKYGQELDRKILARSIKQQSVLDYAIDQLKDALSLVKPLPPKYLPVKDKWDEEEICLLISDCQIGEEVLPEEIHSLGEYNFNTFMNRFSRLMEKVVDITNVYRKAYPVNKLNICFLGDIVNGELIFEGQYLYNQMDLLQQVFEGVYFIANSIASLASHFEKVRIVGVVGNHGRVGKKGQTKPHVNFDLFFYEILRILLQDHENVECYFPRSFFAIEEIRGHTFFLSHGNNINCYLKTPFYGMENAAKDYYALLAKKNIFLDYFVIAHFHRGGDMQLPFGEMIINGSMVGPNLHSIQHLKTGVSPTQLLFGVNEKIGITWRHYIGLD